MITLERLFTDVTGITYGKKRFEAIYFSIEGFIDSFCLCLAVLVVFVFSSLLVKSPLVESFRRSLVFFKQNHFYGLFSS